MKGLVTFGEIMLRMNTPGYLRLRQSLPGTLEVMFAGAEANVAASVALLGGQSRFITALPCNDLSDACIGTLRSVGVDTSWIVKSTEGRLGIFFVEKGANQRPSKVTYDRDYSSIALTNGLCYDWDSIFDGCSWFHTSGITPAISKTAAEATILAVKKAKEKGLTVSLDLNFRNKLWNWDQTVDKKTLARSVMMKILPFVDVLIGNEEDADDMLGIKAGDTDVSKGKLVIDSYPDVAREIKRTYPNVRIIATTLRESISASHNNWGAMLYETASDKVYFAPSCDGKYVPYEIRDIVDRVGGGDSFSAGLIYSLMDENLSKDPQTCLSFAVAASCLCHSISGDFNYVTKTEVMTLMNGDSSGRVKR